MYRSLQFFSMEFLNPHQQVCSRNVSPKLYRLLENHGVGIFFKIIKKSRFTTTDVALDANGERPLIIFARRGHFEEQAKCGCSWDWN